MGSPPRACRCPASTARMLKPFAGRLCRDSTGNALGPLGLVPDLITTERRRE